MPALRELQAAFWRSLTGGAAEASLLGRIRSTPELQAAERLGIYARMYRDRIVEALREDFPRVAAVVGEERFQALAGSYLAGHPSAHPSLRHFGRGLPAFIATGPLPGLPSYLADLSRLEWDAKLRCRQLGSTYIQPVRLLIENGSLVVENVHRALPLRWWFVIRQNEAVPIDN